MILSLINYRHYDKNPEIIRLYLFWSSIFFSVLLLFNMNTDEVLLNSVCSEKKVFTIIRVYYLSQCSPIVGAVMQQTFHIVIITPE